MTSRKERKKEKIRNSKCAESAFNCDVVILTGNVRREECIITTRDHEKYKVSIIAQQTITYKMSKLNIYI